MTYDFALSVLSMSVEFGGLVTGLLIALAALLAATRSRLDWSAERRTTLERAAICLLLALMLDCTTGELAVIWLVYHANNGDLGLVATLIIAGTSIVLLLMPIIGYLAFTAARGVRP